MPFEDQFIIQTDNKSWELPMFPIPPHVQKHSNNSLHRAPRQTTTTSLVPAVVRDAERMSKLTRGEFVGLPQIHQQLAQRAAETPPMEPAPPVEEDDDEVEDVTEQVWTGDT